MAYAVFEGDERLTRVFASEQEAWNAAERAGLIDIDPEGRKILEDHLEIRPCAAEPQEGEDAAEDFRIY